MLLLRALVGTRLILQSLGYIGTHEKGFWVWVITLVTFACGVLLLGGLMTPLVAILVALEGFGLSLSIIPLPNQNFFSGHIAIINLIVLAIAIAALGPGAFSLDARMFGRREITIPKSSERQL